MFNRAAFSRAVVKHVIGDKSLRKAADAAGVSAATLCRIKQGKAPSREVLAQLCEIMGLSVDTFFGRD
jgi:transcriptional regulator with XRE-family HTH domain